MVGLPAPSLVLARLATSVALAALAAAVALAVLAVRVGVEDPLRVVTRTLMFGVISVAVGAVAGASRATR